MVQQHLANGVVLSPSQVATADTLPDPCETFRKTIPSDWQQGHLEVPEDPTSPDGIKIKVFYYGKILADVPPTVFFNGGPGISSHGSFRLFQTTQTKLDPDKKISFVFIDQRGNGCSAYYPQETVFGTDADGEDITDREKIIDRLVHYGSRGIVSDSEFVRRHLLAEKKWNIFGQSFGTHVVHRYLQIAPAGVQSAHGHGNAINANPYTRQKERIASQIRVLDEYLKQFPEDKALIAVLNRELDPRLNPDRCFEYGEVGSGDVMCNYEVTGELVGLLGFTDAWPELHDWFGVLVKDGKLNEVELTRFLNLFYGGSSNPLNRKGFSGSVIAYVDRNTSQENPNYCYQIARDLALTVDLYRTGFHECTWQLGSDEEDPNAPVGHWLAHLKRDILTVEMFKQVLLKNAEIPFYWYSGERDSFVPVANFQEQLAATGSLPNVHYTHFKNTGHDGYYSEPLVWENIIKETLR